jgi:hypothetical protein
MGAHVQIPQDRIAEFCKRYRVRSLALFGSVLRDDFRPDSDVDVLVEFEPHSGTTLFDLVHMQDELEKLFGRKVDVVDAAALRNPFRRHEILKTRQVVYAG